MLRYVVSLTVLALVAAQDDDVCYEPLGCFSMDSPWKSVLRPLPAPFPPEDVNTMFYLYTRFNKRERFNVKTRPDVSVEGSDFDASRTTVFITHGFASNGNSSWLDEMKDALLDRVDANVFLTDWGKGASLLNYFQVASNTRIVGQEMARVIHSLINRKGLKAGNIHLIGHSLGAHISSYAAKTIPGIARLTALDPAQPGFEGLSRTVRLDSSDATYVDVIHSDAKPVVPFLGFGMIAPYGDSDYYLNGGFVQPGCILPDSPPNISSFLDLAKIPVEVISNFISCPHSRSYKVFISSLRNTNCTFWGHPANIISDIAAVVSRGFFSRYITPSTSDCTIKSCSPLALESPNYPARGTFDVATTSDDPYCISEPEVDRNMARSLQNYDWNKDTTTRIPLIPVLPSLGRAAIGGVGKLLG